MNFAEVLQINIPDNEIVKIEKDGVLYWQKDPQWEEKQAIIYYLGRDSGGYYIWAKKTDKWEITKYNYGTPQGSWQNSIPPQRTSADNIIGIQYNGDVNSIRSGMTNKYKYNGAWFANNFSRLVLRYASPGSYSANVEIRIYNSDMSIILGSAISTSRGGTLNIPLNAQGLIYFNSSSSIGKEFILCNYPEAGASNNYFSFGCISPTPINSPILYFQ